MFTALRSATLKALAACAVLSCASGVARADLTQDEKFLPALNAAGEKIVDCDLKLTAQYDPNYEPADGFKPLMFVHGGGWVEGKPLDGKLLPLWNLVTTEFTRRGFIVYSPEYRLIKAPGVKPKPSQASCGQVGREDQHRDVQQGFEASLRMMAGASPRVDIERGMTLVGHSAGAHLATFAALNMPDHLRTWIRGVIPLSGPISFRNYWNQAHGLEPSALRPRHVRLGDYDVTLGAVDAKSRETVYGVLDTYVSEGTGLKKLVDLTAQDPLLVSNTFASVYKPNDRVRPPFYFVQGADDDLAYPEGTIQSCQEIGLISNVKRIARSFLFWTQQHYVGRCGDGADRIHVIAPANHAFNFNQSFWQDALGWSDALEPR